MSQKKTTASSVTSETNASTTVKLAVTTCSGDGGGAGLNPLAAASISDTTVADSAGGRSDCAHVRRLSRRLGSDFERSSAWRTAAGSRRKTSTPTKATNVA